MKSPNEKNIPDFKNIFYQGSMEEQIKNIDHDSIDVKYVLAAIQSPDPLAFKLREAAATSKKLSEDQIRTIYASTHCSYVKRFILLAPNTPEDVLLEAARFGDLDSVKNLMIQKKKSTALFTALFERKHSSINQEIAGWSYLTPKQVMSLLDSHQTLTRIAAVKNVKASPAALTKALGDESELVRAVAKKRLNIE